MIEIRQLSQSYGEKQVLNDVSIVIPEKKITALIGANGAGKSTLVMLSPDYSIHQKVKY